MPSRFSHRLRPQLWVIIVFRSASFFYSINRRSYQKVRPTFEAIYLRLSKPIKPSTILVFTLKAYIHRRINNNIFFVCFPRGIWSNIVRLCTIVHCATCGFNFYFWDFHNSNRPRNGKCVFFHMAFLANEITVNKKIFEKPSIMLFYLIGVYEISILYNVITRGW